ncbi:MAG: hypothetical protein ABJB78_10180 [Betaproteobacteria bacterium]
MTDVTLADAPLDTAWLTRDDDASPVALARRAAWLETPDAKERPPD